MYVNHIHFAVGQCYSPSEGAFSSTGVLTRLEQYCLNYVLVDCFNMVRLSEMIFIGPMCTDVHGHARTHCQTVPEVGTHLLWCFSSSTASEAGVCLFKAITLNITIRPPIICRTMGNDLTSDRVET